jgi:hypothetical protein
MAEQGAQRGQGFRRIFVVDGVEAEGGGSFNIEGEIVYKDRLGSLHAQPVQRMMENSRRRLPHPHVSGVDIGIE